MTQRVTIPKGKRSGLAGLDYHVSKVLTLCNVSVPGSSMAIEVLRIPSAGPKYPPLGTSASVEGAPSAPKWRARLAGWRSRVLIEHERCGYLKDLSRPLVDT